MIRELSGGQGQIIPGSSSAVLARLASRTDVPVAAFNAALEAAPAPIRRTSRSLAQVGGTCYHTLAHAGGGRAAWSYLALPNKINGLIANHQVVGGALSWHLRHQGWAV